MTRTLRLLAVPLGLLWALVACDSGSPGSVDLEDSANGATDTGELWGTRGTTQPGTQVGSEGFWGCGLDETEPVEPQTWLPSLDGTPADLAPPRVGDWPVDVVLEGKSSGMASALSVVDALSYTWVDVKDGPGCTDYLAVTVTAELTTPTDPAVPLSGALAIRPDQSKLIVGTSSDLDTLKASWGPPSFGTTLDLELRLEAGLDASTLDGQLSWVDCPEGTCDSSDLLATVTATR